MKKKWYIKLSVLLLALLFVSACTKNGDGTDEIIYAYNEPVHHPPDEFLMVFNLSTPGDRLGEITFAQNGVWEIEKRGDGKANLFFKHQSDVYSVSRLDTIGFYGDDIYQVIMNNNNHTDMGNYFVGFRKLHIPFDNFENTFP